MTSAFQLEDSVATPLAMHRFTIEQYHQMGELGVLTPEDHVELLEGLIVEKMNHLPIHGYLVGLLNEWFQQKLNPGWIARCQLPITTERSEPEPDLAILKGRHADFRHNHPVGSDCQLLIEVADTSLAKDRAKVSIYCNAGVQEYWIVNVNEKVIERFVFSTEQLVPAEAQIIPASGTINFRLEEVEFAFGLDILFAYSL